MFFCRPSCSRVSFCGATWQTFNCFYRQNIHHGRRFLPQLNPPQTFSATSLVTGVKALTVRGHRLATIPDRGDMRQDEVARGYSLSAPTAIFGRFVLKSCWRLDLMCDSGLVGSLLARGRVAGDDAPYLNWHKATETTNWMWLPCAWIYDLLVSSSYLQSRSGSFWS